MFALEFNRSIKEISGGSWLVVRNGVRYSRNSLTLQEQQGTECSRMAKINTEEVNVQHFY